MKEGVTRVSLTDSEVEEEEPEAIGKQPRNKIPQEGREDALAGARDTRKMREAKEEAREGKEEVPETARDPLHWPEPSTGSEQGHLSAGQQKQRDFVLKQRENSTIGLLEAARRKEAEEKRREEAQQKTAGKARATPKPGPPTYFLPLEVKGPQEEKSKEAPGEQQENRKLRKKRRKQCANCSSNRKSTRGQAQGRPDLRQRK